MRSLLALVAATLLLTGCGGGGTTPEAKVTPTPSTTPTQAPSTTPTPSNDSELKAAVQQYSDAFLTGKVDAAYGLLSARCQKRMSKSEFDGIVGQAKQMYGSTLPIKTFDAQVSGDLARVTYTFAVSAINQDSEPWVRESGKWHEDDC